MSKSDKPVYDTIDASPVKSFFVTMLTRDIRLEDAILDLLDNCVDGILRNEKPTKKTKPYAGFKAEITFNKNLFMIHDNCGGIPWSLHEYAFKMGRSADRDDDPSGTVGVYGIGMKRAIFKMGEQASIQTQNGKHRYEVEIKPDWLGDEEEWRLPVSEGKTKMSKDGTTIVIGSLHKNISERFGADAKEFQAELENVISTHYAFIMDKGFEVIINKKSIHPRPTKLIFSKKTPKGMKNIKPYIWKTKRDGVEVFLTIGFTRPIPTAEEIDNENVNPRHASIDAGWTVLCNDRAVLYCDRTELTGWGDAGIPRYHTQFIAISGIVEFKSDDPGKLPTTTTKRGIDASSRLYLQVKNKMREGMRIFIDYTNKWKGLEDESKSYIESDEVMSLSEIKKESESLKFNKTRGAVGEGSQFIPDLPLPSKKTSKSKDCRISFVKSISDVQVVGNHLFDDENADASTVGEKCFDIILKEAKQ